MFRRTLMAAGLLIFSAVLALPASAQSAKPDRQKSQVSYQISIPAGSLADALDKLVEQAGVQIVYTTALTEGMKVQGLSGSLTFEAALNQLLANTGLRADSISDKTVVLKRVEINRKTEAVKKKDDSKTNSSAAQTPSQEPEEIVVTAQKREERLIEVPQAVSVLSPKGLSNSGMLQLRDYAHSVPGLNLLTRGAGETIVSLRGVTLGNDLGPTVGIYVDEVPYGSSSSLSYGYTLALDSAPFDLERIEILKGPQGTLYGASSMGGVIKYVSKLPSTDSFGGQAQMGTSSTVRGGVSYNGAVAINAPLITDKLALRLSSFYSHDGGYIDNIARGAKDVNRSNIYGGRADLLFTPTEALSIRFTASVQNIDRDGTGTADYSFTGAPPYGSLAQNRPTTEPFEQRFRAVSGTLVYDLNWGSITSITSYQTGKTEFRWDSTALYAPYAQFVFNRPFGGVSIQNSGPTDKLVQEVRLASNGNGPLEWVIGGFYNREITRLDQGALLFDLAGNLTSDDLITTSLPSRFEEYAAFSTLTWHLTDQLNISGGIRYLENRERISQNSSGELGISRPTTRSSESIATYLANARYHFNGHATAYVRYATGYRPGGPNFSVLSPITGLPVGPARFESDSLKSYEIGFKGETEDRRFGIDLAAFLIDWDDIILFGIRDGVGFRGNAPDGARVYGTELTLTARPINALALTSTFAYLDAQMREANADLGAAKGERLPGVPRISAALNADYELPMGSLKPSVGATLRFVDERKAVFGNTSPPQHLLPDYVAVDLRAGLTLGTVGAQLYVRNLFDDRDQLSAITDQGWPQPAIVQPRTIGISVTTSF